MTDDEPRYCAEHHWSAPVPRLLKNAAGELVEHPTERMRFCTGCPAEVSVEKEPK